MTKAYLAAHAILDPEGRFPPMIDRVQIASQPGSSFSPCVGKEVYLTVFESESDTFRNAAKQIAALLTSAHPSFRWCEPLYGK